MSNVDGLFLGWFNNHMAMILLAIQHVRMKKVRSLMKMAFFLESIEHHYVPCDAPRCVRQAFRYLKRYFKVYPIVTQERSKRACEMVARIYEALELEFDFQFSLRQHPVPEAS